MFFMKEQLKKKSQYNGMKNVKKKKKSKSAIRKYV